MATFLDAKILPTNTDPTQSWALSSCPVRHIRLVSVVMRILLEYIVEQ